jgi:hypothetical protein
MSAKHRSLPKITREEQEEEEPIRQVRWKGGDVWVLSGRSILAPVVKRLDLFDPDLD